MNDNINDLIIIGGGPAGLTAAIYTSRASIKTLLIEGIPAGGQLTITTEVENFPGFPEGVQGPDLIAKMRDQALRFNTAIVTENVVRVSGDAKSVFEVELSNGQIEKAKSLIIATGASARWLGLESEKRLMGRGVSACATCDGFFFKNKVIAVVGGGDSAMEEATYLTKFATKVYIIVRGSKEQMRASKFMQEKAYANEKIEFIYNTQVIDILGESAVEGIKILNSLDNTEKTMGDVQGVFVAIGHTPNTGFLKGFVELSELGYLKVTDNTKTSLEGVFAAGDVSDYKYRQAITAAGLGCMASLDVEKFLSGHGAH